MDAEIEVSELEPRLAVEPCNLADRPPRLVGPPPAALVVREAGKRIEDAVEIRRDVKPEHLDVVADVPEDGDPLRVGRLDQAAQEPRAADTPESTATRLTTASPRSGQSALPPVPGPVVVHSVRSNQCDAFSASTTCGSV